MDREYLRTHPWLTFSIDATRFSHEIWLLLGAAQSKCLHIAGVPLDDEHANTLYKVYLIKGVKATTAIEGNSLTEKQIQDILDKNSTIPPSRAYQEQEVKNIIDAYEQVYSNASDKITKEEICKFNSMVLKDLELQDFIEPGNIRKHSVLVGRYRGAPAEDCEYLLSKLCETINQITIGEKWQFASGILKAIITHVYLAWIHPFGDGNGRTARLMEVKICAANGIPKPACQLLSNFYNLTRDKYYLELEKASKSDSSIYGFISYALTGLLDMLDEQIAIIRDYQIQSTWENTVHKVLHGNTQAFERRRHLALELYKNKNPVQKSEIHLLTPKLAELYSNSTTKTLSRDLSVLQEKGFIIIENRRIQINLNKILAWLPARRLV